MYQTLTVSCHPRAPRQQAVGLAGLPSWITNLGKIFTGGATIQLPRVTYQGPSVGPPVTQPQADPIEAIPGGWVTIAAVGGLALYLLLKKK